MIPKSSLDIYKESKDLVRTTALSKRPSENNFHIMNGIRNERLFDSYATSSIKKKGKRARANS